MKEGKVTKPENIEKNKGEGIQVKENLVSKIQKYIEENSKKVMIISLSVIVATVLIFVIKNRIEKSNEEDRIQASVALSRIYPYIQSSEYSKSLYGDTNKRIRNFPVIGLIDIVNKYSGTKQAAIGSLLAANSFIWLDKYQDAHKYFEKALDSPSKVILEAANAGLGITNEKSGKYKDAEQYYEKAASLATTISNKNKYQYYQALMCEKIGNKEKAETLFREIIGDNQSEYVGIAKAGLIRLGMIIE